MQTDILRVTIVNIKHDFLLTSFSEEEGVSHIYLFIYQVSSLLRPWDGLVSRLLQKFSMNDNKVWPQVGIRHKVLPVQFQCTNTTWQSCWEHVQGNFFHAETLWIIANSNTGVVHQRPLKSVSVVMLVSNLFWSFSRLGF